MQDILKTALEAHQKGNISEAVELYNKILKQDPFNADANHNLGVILNANSRKKEAISYFKVATNAKVTSQQHWVSLIIAQLEASDQRGAMETLKAAKTIHPNIAEQFEFKKQTPELQGTLSSLLRQARKYSKENHQDKANKIYRQILKKYPANKEAKVALKIGKSRETTQKDKSLQITLTKLKDFLQKNQYTKALEVGKSAISQFPNNCDLYNLIGVAHIEKKQFHDAEEYLQRSCELDPNFHVAWYNLAYAQEKLEKLSSAIQNYQMAIRLNNQMVGAYNNLACILLKQGNHYEAAKVLEGAVAQFPTDPQTLYNLANCQKALNKIDDAIDTVNSVIEIQPSLAQAHLFRSNIVNSEVAEECIHEAVFALSSSQLEPRDKSDLYFAIANLYDKIGKVNDAFEAYTEANKLRKFILDYDIEQDKRLFNALKRTSSVIRKAGLQASYGETDPTPIFIVGMPRSGTSLLEQIISSHSKVFGCGELKMMPKLCGAYSVGIQQPAIAELTRIRAQYIEYVRSISGGASHTTDKLPHNFQNIPMIFATFPKAKVINVVRDPRAVCWSNFKTPFSSLDGLGYCYDLLDTVKFFKLYHDLMLTWSKDYQEKIYNCNYETLTQNPDSEIPKLIRYLELPWEDVCLTPHRNKRIVQTASQQQVRQKIYQNSSEYWKRYEQHVEATFYQLKEYLDRD